MNKMLCLCLFSFLLVACGDSEYPKIESSGPLVVPTIDNIYLPSADGEYVMDDGIVLVDYSNCDYGYVMAKTQTSDHSRIKIRISKDDEEYTYDLSTDERYITYPLNMGSGEYNVKVYENIEGSSYALINSEWFYVELIDDLYPYLYPSIIVDYDVESKAVKKSFSLCKGKTTEIERVHAIYRWITKNIDYDYDKLDDIRAKYVLPDLDRTLNTNKGTCFDYAGLMTCMLRVQQIPCKVITGYVEQGYHAWVEVYIKDVGWINPSIYFESESWTRIDPTFDSMSGDYDGSYENVYEY